MSDNREFVKGVIVGLVAALLFCSTVSGLVYLHKRDKGLLKYVEKNIEIEALREDYSNCAVDEFLEIPDVRRAADGAAAEFERKRDEIVQRFRNKLAD